MTATLADVERLYDAVKNLRDERRKMEKLSQKAFSAEGPKATTKANVDLNWQAFHVNKLSHTVHAIAVDCGIADLRSPTHYATYTVKLSGFHEYEVVPLKPRALSQSESA